VFGASVEVNWDVGPGTLTSITAYREFDWNNFQTTDKSPFDIFGTGITEDQDQFSQELRFAGMVGDRIDYVVGALYFTQTMEAEAYADVGADAFSPFGAPLGANPAPGTGFIDIRTRAESMAAFAQLDWRMTDALQATLGVRYTAEDKSISHQLFGEPTETFVPSVPLNRFQRSDREPSWRAGLQYFVNDDVMAYASYSRGFKAGGYNAFAFQIVQPDGTPADFEPEFVDNYEIGVKTLLADGRVRFNATAFFMDYEDLQVNQLIPNAQGVIDFQTSNAATAETRGIELELAARLMAGLDLTVGYGYTDAKFKRFPGATPGGADFGGNRLAQSPRQSLGATLQYRYGLTGDWDLMARGEYIHRASRFSDAANSPALEVPAYDLVNVRLGLERSDGTLGAWLWSRNLFDKDYANSRFFGSPAFAPGAIFQNIGIERTWGLEVSYRWAGR
jgi:iron complex outermembrane receptor protein